MTEETLVARMDVRAKAGWEAALLAVIALLIPNGMSLVLLIVSGAIGCYLWLDRDSHYIHHPRHPRFHHPRFRWPLSG